MLHLQSYLEPLVIRFGLTIAFPSGGMGVTVTLRVTVVDEVSHKRFLIAFCKQQNNRLGFTPWLPLRRELSPKVTEGEPHFR